MTTLQAIEYLMENPCSICKTRNNIFMRVFISGEGYKFLMCFEEDDSQAKNIDYGLFQSDGKTIKEIYNIPMECKWKIVNDKNLLAKLN